MQFWGKIQVCNEQCQRSYGHNYLLAEELVPVGALIGRMPVTEDAVRVRGMRMHTTENSVRVRDSTAKKKKRSPPGAERRNT